MSDAFIFDAVRSPRGRGKPDGGLHEVTPVNLVSQVLAALRDRNDLDTAVVGVGGLVAGEAAGGGGVEIAAHLLGERAVRHQRKKSATTRLRKAGM